MCRELRYQLRHHCQASRRTQKIRGRGRATKQDGSLERVLRAVAIPEGRRGREDSRTTHWVRSPSTPTTAATRNHARGLRRSGTQGRKLATRPRPIRPGKRVGVASSEDRGRRARSGKEPAEQAAGTAGAVTTRIHLPTTPTNIRGPSTPHRETGRRSKGVRPLRQPGEEPGQRGGYTKENEGKKDILRTINKWTRRQEEGKRGKSSLSPATKDPEKREETIKIQDQAGTEHLYPYRNSRRETRALRGQTLQTIEAMPGNKPNHKPVSKPARQLLFSEALQHKRLTPTKINPQTSPPLNESTTMSDKDQPTTMDRILQEITTVSRRIEEMDASITSLTLETKSMRSNIAGFQSRVTGLEQRMGSLETQINTSQEREQDFLYLRSKLTDMEDRSRRDNIGVLGIPENEEGSDMQAFLTSTLPKIILLDFDLPLEFQRAHRIGPKCSDNSSRPRPIIACLLRHNRTRQILQVARNHGPFRIDQHEIRITADYSKETNERRKAFLALRPGFAN
ncbi:hypothetical protein NDU88_003512 [Pleurodeles waltl]|uniref:Uncharacterized protein n=1 Tax=Pleurodeles waltl TaxID=8319 RepID=A0AAV7RIQ5_PLEWA|nr:hypothetical protein NDU88_003512 [Pleurodeles waltl]